MLINPNIANSRLKSHKKTLLFKDMYKVMLLSLRFLFFPIILVNRGQLYMIELQIVTSYTSKQKQFDNALSQIDPLILFFFHVKEKFKVYIPDFYLQKEMTPLHVSAQNGHRDVIQALLDHGSNINAQNYVRIYLCQYNCFNMSSSLLSFDQAS